ncbi:hypothetical protein ATE84_4154 [Aquimarina sp. MAR_2010_214]|uniref:hypothetical protein n=1 Tax=Aquimarina sp. MAR_2010_214 TaxID=1250026 RepID=UPI000C6FFC69|nr:hypothetical protein [Aquimarina sp. MAR_2010_214]PKV52052.1 hypothetical protein ATE84_4154 [Aquimarina sp. MAR_2010_214]
MKTYIITFTLLCCCFLNAQDNLSKDYAYTIGEPYENIEGVYNGYWPFYYTLKDSQIMSVKGNRKQLVVQKFDTENLNLISSKEITDLPENKMQEKIVALNNRYYYFYSSWSGRKTKHERLYYKEINFEKGTFSDQSTLLIDIPEKIKSFVGLDKFDINTSRDSTKLVVKYTKIPKIKNNKKSFELIKLHVFDQNLKEIWSKEYKMPYSETKTRIIDYKVSTYGDVYILSKIFHDNSKKDKKRGKDGAENYHLEVVKISKDSESTLTLGLDDKYINAANMHLNKTGELTVTGFYTQGNVKERYISNDTDGVFIFRFDKGGDLIYKKAHEIPTSILKQYESDKTRKKLKEKESKNEAEFTNLTPQYLGINDTGITLIGEQFFETEYKGRFRQHYHDMLITKLDNKGDLLWMKKLPKKQKRGKEETRKELSFTYFLSNDNHHLIFLDNIKNIELPLNKVPHLHIGGYGGYLMTYKISDDNGTVSKDAIFDTNKVGEDELEVDYRNGRLIEISKNEFIIEVLSKKKNRLIKISF